MTASEPLIHIGFYKAASSWLQKHYFKPELGYQQILDPFGVQLSLIDPAPFQYNCQHTLDGIARHYPAEELQGLQAVVSSETLSGDILCGGYNARQNADRIKETWPEAKILLITREQKSLIRSMYKTMVLWGLPHGIKRLLNSPDPRSAPQFNLNFIRFDQLAAYYTDLYGKDKVLVLPYEFFQHQPREFIEQIHEFSTHKKLSEDQYNSLPIKKVVNSNQSLTLITLQRLINSLFLSNAFNGGGLITTTEKKTWSRIRRHKKLPPRLLLDDYLEARFKTIVEQATNGQFADSNRKLQDYCKIDLSLYHYEL